jgi:phage tail-like protein
MSTFPGPIGSVTSPAVDDWLRMLVETIPANYRPPEVLDFLQRFVRPDAENLARLHFIYDNLYTYLDPFSCPEDWLPWLTTEWLGWKLMPD